MQSSPTARLKSSQAGPQILKLAHSPDCDDAFMFYALATKKIRGEGVQFEHVLEDIETLNQKALQGTYDITAVSFHAYAYLAERYLLLPSGSSFGEGYGPVVVSRTLLGSGGLKGKRVAVPGKMTTAYLVLQLYESDIEALVTPFDQILDRVAKGEVDAGVIIHEGQLMYARESLRKVVDLGEWWTQKTQLPLPLGGNAVRRSLEPGIMRRVAALLKESIEYGLEHREEALAYAVNFGRGLDTVTADAFVSMYVNHYTVDCGERGRKAVELLLDQAHEKGLVPHRAKAEFVE